MDECNPKNIGIVVRSLHHKIGRAISSSAQKVFGDSATGLHGWVLSYLYDHRDSDVFQKDLEKRFSVRRSTMTSILQLMEKNGMIVRTPVSYDARLKKLTLTPKAVEMNCAMREQIRSIEQAMKSGITEDELALFISVAEKISANLTDCDN